MFNCSAIPLLLNRVIARIEALMTLRDELSIFLFCIRPSMLSAVQWHPFPLPSLFSVCCHRKLVSSLESDDDGLATNSLDVTTMIVGRLVTKLYPMESYSMADLHVLMVILLLLSFVFVKELTPTEICIPPSISTILSVLSLRINEKQKK
jgi:hypothetical protein